MQAEVNLIRKKELQRKMKIVILAGGTGTRLFPLSRSCYPKQFLEIAGQPSLLSQTITRFRGIAKDSDIIITTNEQYYFHVKDELQRLNATDINVITELEGRNTAPAIALAMTYAVDELGADASEVMLVSPSDHIIKPVDKFAALVEEAMPIAASGNIVTLGVRPTKPETEYGYIEATDEAIGCGKKVAAFREKPDEATAQEYLKAGNYFWNSGILIFTIGTMQKEIEALAPEIFALAKDGYNETKARFTEMPNISIDYAIAEKSDKMAVALMDGIEWRDIGSFDAIFSLLKGDDGNATYGDVKSADCHNTMMLGGKRLIVGMGLENIMVVDTPDALLVTQRGESPKVKDIVKELKAEQRHETNENLTMFRPWGSYTVLIDGDGYKVKKIVVNPGARLSLQMHYHRSEHWTVISGTGKVTLDDREIIFRENESTFIPIGTRHRLENPGKIPLAVIEVQCGKYLGEDDIVRFSDDYNRK